MTNSNFAQQLSFSFEDGENTPFVTFPANKRICVEGIKPKRNVKPLLPQLQTGLPLEKFLALYDITSISYKHSLLNIDNNKITKNGNGKAAIFVNENNEENECMQTTLAWFDENGQLWTAKMHVFLSEPMSTLRYSFNNYNRYVYCENYTFDKWSMVRNLKLMHDVTFLQNENVLSSILESQYPYTAAWAKEVDADTCNLLMAPELETLCKAGFVFANSLLKFNQLDENSCTYFNRLCQVGSKPKTIFKTSKVIYSVLKGERNLEVWDCYRRLDKTGKIKEDNVAQAYGQRYDIKDLYYINSILAKRYNDKPVFTWNSLINYLGRLDTFEAIEKKEAFILLNDYLSMCNQLQMEPRVDGDSLKREHDIAARNCRNKRDEIISRDMQESCERMKKYNYTEGVYFVRAITSHDDLLDEANQQHNCVASYGRRIANGSSYIYVMREVANPEKSLITIELSPNGKTIRQKFLAYNRPIHNKSQSDFIERWLKFCKSR